MDQPEAKPFVKPPCKLIGQDGNVFNLIGIASRTLRKAGYPDKAKELVAKEMSCGSYNEALNLLGEYVEIE